MKPEGPGAVSALKERDPESLCSQERKVTLGDFFPESLKGKQSLKWTACRPSKDGQSERRDEEATSSEVLKKSSFERELLKDIEEFAEFSPQEKAELKDRMNRTEEEIRKEIMVPDSSECPEIAGTARESRNPEEDHSAKGTEDGRNEKGAPVLCGPVALGTMACTLQGCIAEDDLTSEVGSPLWWIIPALAASWAVAYFWKSMDSGNRREDPNLPFMGREPAEVFEDRPEVLENRPEVLEDRLEVLENRLGHRVLASEAQHGAMSADEVRHFVLQVQAFEGDEIILSTLKGEEVKVPVRALDFQNGTSKGWIMMTARDLGIAARRRLNPPLPGRTAMGVETRIVSSTGENCSKWQIVPEMYEKLKELML